MPQEPDLYSEPTSSRTTSGCRPPGPLRFSRRPYAADGAGEFSDGDA
jgi:hypothetical protein